MSTTKNNSNGVKNSSSLAQVNDQVINNVADKIARFIYDECNVAALYNYEVTIDLCDKTINIAADNLTATIYAEDYHISVSANSLYDEEIDTVTDIKSHMDEIIEIFNDGINMVEAA